MKIKTTNLPPEPSTTVSFVDGKKIVKQAAAAAMPHRARPFFVFKTKRGKIRINNFHSW
jgi:hypothetical protein